MRLNEQKMTNFGGKWRFSGGSGGVNLKNQKIRVCYHKTQLLCFNLSSNYKDKPRHHNVRKCVTLVPPPLKNNKEKISKY